MKSWLFFLIFIFSFSVSAVDLTEKQNAVPESKVTKSHVKAYASQLFYSGDIVGNIFLAAGTGAVLAGYTVINSDYMLSGATMIAVGGGLKLCAAAFRKK